MAKKKMTLEEKLEEAIVKDAPYEVPENWVWSRLGYLGKWSSGGTPSRKHPEYYQGTIPWLKTGELNNAYIYNAEEKITHKAIEKSSAKIFVEGTVLLAMYGATIGKVAILGIEAATNQACAAIECNKLLLNNKFIFYYLMSQKDNFIELGKGGAQPNISQTIIKQYRCPLPPLQEQQRIVDRIENLFEKLDNAKELIEEARNDFEKRKSAITSKIFRGDFNKRCGTVLLDQEEGYYDIPLSWRWVKLKNICEKITDGTHNSPKSYPEGEYKYVTAKNIKECGIDLSNITYLTKEDHTSIYNRCDVKYGDVLYIKDGATTGIATINNLEEEFSLLSSVALLRPNNYVVNSYLSYVLNSKEIKNKILESVKGVAITRLTLKKLNDIIIPLPPLEEQKEIVRILDNLLEEESKIDELTQLEEQIELIKKSILAKAFRGQLGTNCPEEESALELLKEILDKE